MQICTVCGKKYKAHRGQRKYCSYECNLVEQKRRANKKKRVLYAKCPVCKELFELKRTNQKYCSDNCKAVGEKINKLKRERRKENVK